MNNPLNAIRNTPASASASPWYREPWPWLLMLGPFTVIIAGAITVWLAISSADGLVDDDYYKQGLAVNQRIHRDREAFDRGMEADVTLSESSELSPLPASRRNVVVSLKEKASGSAPPMLRIRFSHPTVAGRDVSLSLAIGPDGSYRAPLDTPLLGRWLVSLEDSSARWRLVGEWSPEKSSVLHLAPRDYRSPNRDESK